MASAPAWLSPLMARLEVFAPAFSAHAAKRGGLRRYFEGMLSDSRPKSMETMWARPCDPGSYRAPQYFITDAEWSADRVWRFLRAAVPAREGVLVLDDTGFPKQGSASVGVARQYSGTLGKVGNCQVSVTAELRTCAQAWCVGALLHLPQTWLTPAQSARGKILARVDFREKWRLALALLRQVRAAAIAITAVVADAEFGDGTTFRRTLHRLQLAYAVGVSSTLTVFCGTPAMTAAVRPTLAPGVVPVELRDRVATVPARPWRTVSWRNGANAPRGARFWPGRVTPAHDWRRRVVAPEIWLLCQCDRGPTPETEYYFVHLPPTASLKALVRITHQRWAIEQLYAELKDELGFDHFEGRSYHGWQRHVVLTAIAYAFLQGERFRHRRDTLTFL